MSDPIEKAFVEWLAEITEFDCYYARRPQGYDQLPAVVIEKQAEERDDCFDCRAVNIPFTFVVRVWTTDPVDTLGISTTIRQALDGFSGDMNGRIVCYASFEGEEDDVEPPFDDSDRWIYGRHTNYEIIVEDA